jgi:hypothetical protein
MTDHPTAPTSHNPPKRPACGSRAYLPTVLVPLAVGLAPAGSGEPADVQRQLRCVLEEHHEGPHYGFVLDLEGIGTGAVWTRWRTEEEPGAVFVLADCDLGSPDGMDACEEFAGHPGGHTWQLADPWRDARV